MQDIDLIYIYIYIRLKDMIYLYDPSIRADHGALRKNHNQRMSVNPHRLSRIFIASHRILIDLQIFIVAYRFIIDNEVFDL